MNQIGVGEFVRRLKILLENPDSRFSFFLGAGCSVSSGIPAAGTLVRRWLPKLEQRETGGQNHHDEWVKEIFPGYDGDNAARFYGEVMKKLLPSAEERQQEIERLVEGEDPGFGYAVLAQLISDPTYGRHCNIVLTTNFDDLVADALYLYTNKKPLVILHESLFGFVRIGRTRPLVLKLHGDARVQPKNITSETKQLDEAVERVLIGLLQETGLIFIGYGGNDKSIVGILEQLPGDKPPWGVYWIGERMPGNDMVRWLEAREANWVKQRDFDELMLLIWNEFHMKHPEKTRFDNLLNQYFETFKKLKSKVRAKPESEEKRVLEIAAEKAASEFKNWWAVELQASKYRDTDPERAQQIYEKGLEQLPDSAALLGTYALFLKNVRKDHDRAEEFYKKAIDADPSDADNLGNYANFLKDVRKDHDRGEEFYKKAIDADPSNATTLGNYANFLTDIRKDHDRAEEFYKKAIEADPNHAKVLGNYAIFFKNVRKDHDRAEELYKKAIEADPNNTILLGNYAVFLDSVRQEYDRAEEFFTKAMDADPKHAASLANCAGFLLARGRYEEGLVLLSKALKLSADNPKQELGCRFYQYAHAREEKAREEGLARMKQLIKSVEPSTTWHLEGNVERAVEDGHPHPEFLKTLAKVISDEIDAKELDKSGEWRDRS